MQEKQCSCSRLVRLLGGENKKLEKQVLELEKEVYGLKQEKKKLRQARREENRRRDR